MTVAHIALGSNLGDRAANLAAAIDLLRRHPRIKVPAVSSPYDNPAVGGPADSPPFLNAAATLETDLSARELLSALHAVEATMGRRRREKWEPRVIDLDLLLFADQVIDAPDLRVPHPLMHERRFVLIPLAEIAGDAIHPVLQRRVANLAAFENAVQDLSRLRFREDFDAALTALYRQGTDQQRAELRGRYASKSLGEPAVWRNPADYGRSDLTREQRLWDCLLLMSIREGSGDYRDDLMGVAFCYHNFALLGMDPDAILSEVASISGPTFSKLLLGFVQRKQPEKGPAAFGLKLVNDAGVKSYSFGQGRL